MKSTIFIVLCVSIILISRSNGQTDRPLKLDEAIDLIIKNSYQLKFNNAKIDEAYAILHEAEERKLPNASASVSYLRLAGANVNLKTKSSSGGGTGDAPPNVSQAMYGLLNASMPLYAGGRINYGIESARYLAEASRMDATDQKEKLIQKCIEAYVNLCKARAAVRLVKENLQNAHARINDLSSLEKNGLLARNDLMKAELQATTIESTLVDAENSWQLANINMDIMLGLDDHIMLQPDTTELTQKIDLQSLDHYLKIATGRQDIAAIEKRKQVAEIGIKSIKAETLPSVQLTGGYIALNIPQFLSVTNALNLGLGVSYDLASLWKNKSKLAQAESKVKQIEATENMMDDEIRLEINKNYLNVIGAQKKVEVYTKSIDQASENFRIVNNKFKNNLATTTDLLDADVALLQTRLAQSFVRADALLAFYQLLHAAGVPLQVYLNNN
jgi:outer membrane protein